MRAYKRDHKRETLRGGRCPRKRAGRNHQRRLRKSLRLVWWLMYGRYKLQSLQNRGGDKTNGTFLWNSTR